MPPSKITRFLAFRYSLIARPQLPLGVIPLPNLKGAAILLAMGLEGNEKFVYWERQYAFIGFHDYILPFPGSELVNVGGRYFVGRIAKRTVLETGDLVEGDVLESLTESWVPVWCATNVVRQIIIIELNPEFGDVKQVQNVLIAGLREPLLRWYGYNIFIEPVGDSQQFWDIMTKYPLVYEIQINLVSPNILDTDRAARESLAAVQELFGQDEVTVTLESHTGNLTPYRRVLENFLDYISNGEGWWKVAVKKLEQNRKRIFSSRQKGKEVLIELPPDSREPEHRVQVESLVVHGVTRVLPESERTIEKQEELR